MGAPGKAGVLVRPDSLRPQPKHGIGGIESVVRVAGGASGPNTDAGLRSLPRVGLVLLVDQLDRGTLTLRVRLVRTRRTFVL